MMPPSHSRNPVLPQLMRIFFRSLASVRPYAVRSTDMESDRSFPAIFTAISKLAAPLSYTRSSVVRQNMAQLSSGRIMSIAKRINAKAELSPTPSASIMPSFTLLIKLVSCSATAVPDSLK